jgi:hypothetical protein
MDPFDHVCHRFAAARAPAFLFVGMLLATSAKAAPHFVTIINDADRTVTSIEAAPAGTHRWHALDIGGSLIGGRSGEVAVRFDGAEACKQDLLVTYRGLAPLTITKFDICRADRIYLGKVLARARRATPIGAR